MNELELDRRTMLKAAGAGLALALRRFFVGLVTRPPPPVGYGDLRHVWPSGRIRAMGSPSNRRPAAAGLAALALLAAALSSCSDKGEGKGPHAIYRVEFSAGPYDKLHVFVNGVPAVSDTMPPDIGDGYLNINWFLQDGENDLRVVAEDPNGNGRALVVDLVELPPDGDLKKASVVWRCETDPQVVEPRVLKKAAKFVAHPGPGWAWQKSPPIETLSEADRSALMGQVQALREAFAGKDAGKILEVLRPGMEEMLRSVNEDYGQAEQASRKSFEEVFVLPDCRVSAAEPEEIQLHIYGRMVMAEVAGKCLVEARGQPKPGESLGVTVKRLVFFKAGGRWVAVHLM